MRHGFAKLEKPSFPSFPSVEKDCFGEPPLQRMRSRVNDMISATQKDGLYAAKRRPGFQTKSPRRLFPRHPPVPP
jgi:hypothetical protein